MFIDSSFSLCLLWPQVSQHATDAERERCAIKFRADGCTGAQVKRQEKKKEKSLCSRRSRFTWRVALAIPRILEIITRIKGGPLPAEKRVAGSRFRGANAPSAVCLQRVHCGNNRARRGGSKQQKRDTPGMEFFGLATDWPQRISYSWAACFCECTGVSFWVLSKEGEIVWAKVSRYVVIFKTISCRWSRGCVWEKQSRTWEKNKILFCLITLCSLEKVACVV